jgi:hypothetical protein
VQYATAAQSALAGSDFTPRSGTVKFPAGTTSVDVAVVVRGDATPEPDETFGFTLANPSGGAALDRSSATGAVLNDD